MHTHDHFLNTIAAVASAAVAGGAVVAAISGATPEYLTQYYVDQIVAVISTIASAFYSLRNRAPVAEPEAPAA